MRPTPETDALRKKFQHGNLDESDLLYSHAELELQRDEALSKIAMMEKSIADMSHPNIVEVLAQLTQARADDDRNNQLMVELMRQRDEAREMTKQWHAEYRAINDLHREMGLLHVSVTKHRDELLAALEDMANMPEYNQEDSHRLRHKARAAIAAVKGEK